MTPTEPRTIEQSCSTAVNNPQSHSRPRLPATAIYLFLPPATPVERAFWDELVKSRRVRRKVLVAMSGVVSFPQSRLTPKALRLLDLYRKAVHRDTQRQLREQHELRARRMQEPEAHTSASTNSVDWLSPQLKDQSGQDAFVYQSWQEKPKPKGFAMPDASRKHPKIGEVTDFYGDLWDVRQIRPTRHGFDVLYGSPASGRDLTGALLRLIPTRELREFWHTNRAKTNGFIFDLPAGRTTLKRARQRFGFNFRDDVTEFWTNRIDDLQALSGQEFAAKHGVNYCSATARRQTIFGNRVRPAGWWRKPKYVGILLADLTLGQAGKKLGISPSQTHRLRKRARAEREACAS
jgi:hypothetical protein